MKTYRVHFAIDVPILFAVDVLAESREEAERLARENPWESNKPDGPTIATEWENDNASLEFDWESERPLILVTERGDHGIEEVDDGSK